MQTDDLISQVAERAFQRDNEKFKREAFEFSRKRREAKEQKDNEAGQSAESESADN